MKKAIVIGAIAATALLLAACQQPKPAAVETPAVTTPAVTETTTPPVIQVTGTATIGEAQEEGKETIKVSGVAEIGGADNTQLTITPKAEIIAPSKDVIKVNGTADINPAN